MFTSASDGCRSFWEGEITLAGCNYEKVQSQPNRKLQISWPSEGSDLAMCLVNICYLTSSTPKNMHLNALGVGMAITPMEVIVDIERGIILLPFHPTDDTNDVHFLTLPNYRFVENCFLPLETEIKQVQ